MTAVCVAYLDGNCGGGHDPARAGVRGGAPARSRPRLASWLSTGRRPGPVRDSPGRCWPDRHAGIGQRPIHGTRGARAKRPRGRRRTVQFEPATFAEYAVRADCPARLPVQPRGRDLHRGLDAVRQRRRHQAPAAGDLRRQPRLLARQDVLALAARYWAHGPAPASVRPALPPPDSADRPVRGLPVFARVWSETWLSHSARFCS